MTNHQLTPREKEIVEHILNGLTSKQAAREHRTVEAHRSHILDKTGARNMVQLAHQLAAQ